MTRYFAFGAILFSTACLEVKDTDTSLEEPGEDTSVPADTADTDVPAAPMSAWISWNADGATLNIENATDSVYYFGMAQTNDNTNSVDANNDWLWVAEDCHYGYTGPNSTEVQFKYCHEVPADDDGDTYIALELISLRDTAGVTQTGNPQNTYLTQNHPDDGSELTWGYTYILEDATNQECYVWGNSPAFYDDFYYACTWMPEWDL